jgi:hypothetical protein
MLNEVFYAGSADVDLGIILLSKVGVIAFS